MMENSNSLQPLKIPAAFDTPEVELDVQNEIFKIEGNSYPENPITFYTPVHQWFSQYAFKPLKKTVVKIHFKYFSTSSTQIFFEIFKILEDIRNQGNEVIIRWIYDSENEEIKESGETYSTLFCIPFELMESKESL